MKKPFSQQIFYHNNQGRSRPYGDCGPRCVPKLDFFLLTWFQLAEGLSLVNLLLDIFNFVNGGNQGVKNGHAGCKAVTFFKAFTDLF